ncbi:MAG TPA: hypothetical protein VJP02_17525 [Candidatus Sulfotelmatobacter sp.]|nr:hypothetical protein [Candidatus Sulfotelmatobacter sp.]
MKLEEVNTRTKEPVDFLVAALESGHSEVLTAYLGAMAKFHTYSFGNIMLIARQKPDASNVAGLRTWNSLGRFVKLGENKSLFSPRWLEGEARRIQQPTNRVMAQQPKVTGRCTDSGPFTFLVSAKQKAKNSPP